MAFDTSSKRRATLFPLALDFLALHCSASLDVVDGLMRNLSSVNAGSPLPSTFGLGIPRGCITDQIPVPRRGGHVRERVCVPHFFSRMAHEVCRGRAEDFRCTWTDRDHHACTWGYGEHHLTVFVEEGKWFMRVSRAGWAQALDACEDPPSELQDDSDGTDEGPAAGPR